MEKDIYTSNTSALGIRIIINNFQISEKYLLFKID